MVKKIVFSILTLLVIVILAVGAYYWLFYRTAEVTAPSFDIKDQKITENEKPFKIDITYPHISGADEFNTKADSYITKQLADFKKNSLENDEAVKKVDPESYAKFPRTYDMMVNYAKGEIDGSAISIILRTYQFEGGAHGSTNFYSINYSPKNKKEIKLTDLFPNQNDYLQKISDFCKPELAKQIRQRMETTEGSWIDQGAGPEEKNFSTFLINKDNIVFYFPQYQVAPYAAGDFQVTMPR